MEEKKKNKLNSEKISKIWKKVSWIMKWFRKYGRKVGWIVERFGKYEIKVSWIVKYGK
jgi:hypothetical protein